MRYAIYGINRVTKDFLYVFDNFDVTYFIEDIVTEKEFCGKPVICTSQIEKNMYELFDKIIICEFDKKQKEAVLISIGYEYEKDYIFEQDLFYLLDNDQCCNVEEKPIVVWGTGKRAENFVNCFKKLNIEFFVDSDERKTLFKGKKVVVPSAINNWKQYFIIVAIKDNAEVIQYLKEQGLNEKENFCTSDTWLTTPSKLLKETIFSKRQYDVDCKSMFNNIELHSTGDMYCCCATFLYQSLGNCDEKEFNLIWNSNLHKILCLSLNNKTYSFCKHDMCPLFVGKEAKEINVLDDMYKLMEKRPDTTSIAYDSSCNLKCITCRDDFCIAKDEELDKVLNYTNYIKKELIPHTKFLVMAGNGEVFYSKAYKELYMDESCKNIKWIRLLSNGMLFNEANWNEFIKGKTAQIMLTVSIDAATRETYEKVRRGGNFDVLRKNMEFASKLRKDGNLSYFRINFVVQSENYKEMIDFVEWGVELGVDEVFFTKVLNWGTYTSEEFKEISMMEEDGNTPKKELQRILDDPRMKNPIVDLGTIQYSHEMVNDAVDNYYMWELKRKVKTLFEE